MFTFASILLAGSAVSGVFAAPRANQGAKLNQRSTPNGQGTGSDGFFWSSWSDGTDQMTFTNGDDGQYSVSWSGSGDIVVGKGWETGSAQDITYSGTYNPDGGSFLSVYGWFTDPLTEYYILEDFGTANPAYGITHVGNLTSDGSLYQIYQTERVNAASIKGTTNFHQYWSIRQDKRVGGTINTANHFNAWKAAGLELGTFNYQIIATEGISGSGNSSITISKSGTTDGSSSAAPSSTATPLSSVLSSAASSTATVATSVISSVAATSVLSSIVSSGALTFTSSQVPTSIATTSADGSSSAASIDRSVSTGQTFPQGTETRHHHHPHGTGVPFFHPNGTGIPSFHHHHHEHHHHHLHSSGAQPTATLTSSAEATLTSTDAVSQATGEPDDDC